MEEGSEMRSSWVEVVLNPRTGSVRLRRGDTDRGEANVRDGGGDGEEGVTSPGMDAQEPPAQDGCPYYQPRDDRLEPPAQDGCPEPPEAGRGWEGASMEPLDSASLGTP